MTSDNTASVLEAHNVLSSSVKGDAKERAHKYLDEFQKSEGAWPITHDILASAQTSDEAKMFAAITLKGKIVYDLDQLPREQLPALRDSILSFLTAYGEGPRPIRTQLCVSLAILAILMTEWKNVLQSVGSTLGATAGDAVLEFLKVLPEEVYDGRKINLSEEAFDARSQELIGDNGDQVLNLLVNYATSSAKAASNPLLLDCSTSWMRVIPVIKMAQTPLLETIFQAVGAERSFDAAVECLCNIFRDTRDVDESMDLIKVLYPRVLALRPKLQIAGSAEDSESLKGLTRIFAEAGEAWVVLMARMPKDFRGLVEAILESCVHDKEKEAVSITFNFWYDLKQMILLEKWEPARKEYFDIFGTLVDVMIHHLEFPTVDGDDPDLFDGDRELEEKFRTFRHDMGDVLKDCCEVITVSECLEKAFNLIKKWITTYASQATDTNVPHWQELEAPLFAMRAMGRMVGPDESLVLHQVLPLIVQIPNHPKLRFQAIMAIGRYTEWTAAHPEFLQPQFEFVVKGFNDPDPEVIRGAALAFRYFGVDCKRHLQGEIAQIQGFYNSTLDKLQFGSQEELTEGAASVISGQPRDKIYAGLKMFCDPVIERLKQRATAATNAPDAGKKAAIEAVANTLSLVTLFIDTVHPYYEPNETNQAVAYCQEIFPILSTIGASFIASPAILEPLCRCWRTMVFSYRTSIFPLLEPLAQQLSSGFETTRQGCFLWATTAVLREFSVDTEAVDAQTTQAVYSFFEQQSFAFLKIMDDLPPQELPDVIDDFFRLLADALVSYHDRLVPAAICGPILTAALSALSLESEGPVLSTLHFVRDLLSYGTDNPASSSLSPTASGSSQQANKEAVLALVRNQGESLVQRILTGMMFTFPAGVLQDASGCVLNLYSLAPRETTQWIASTIDLLPAGTVKPAEKEKLLRTIEEKGAGGQEARRVRNLVSDFASGYRRRNVMPREGLGKLEPSRFRYAGT